MIERGENRDLIFVNFERFPISEPQSNRALKHYVRIVGRFQYRPANSRIISQPETKSTPRPREVEQVIVQSTVGFGWRGIYERQIKDLSEFTVLLKVIATGASSESIDHCSLCSDEMP
jgi:hypothetical protein